MGIDDVDALNVRVVFATDVREESETVCEALWKSQIECRVQESDAFSPSFRRSFSLTNLYRFQIYVSSDQLASARRIRSALNFSLKGSFRWTSIRWIWVASWIVGILFIVWKVRNH
jgi:hypothetical protein